MITHQPVRHRQLGLSIVELMVGVAVGLFIVGGAGKLFVDYVGSNKRLLLETRVNQDLRAAADLVARDVRRAGYWNNATTGVWSPGAGSVVANPHSAVVPSSGTTSFVNYSYARNSDNTLDSNEYTGFRLQPVNGINVLQMWVGGAPGAENYQAITDPGTVNISTFDVTAASPALVNDLSSYCSCLKTFTCTMASIAAAGAPTLTIPRFTIVLTGRAVADPAIVRTVSETVRVRNAKLSGACPS